VPHPSALEPHAQNRDEYDHTRPDEDALDAHLLIRARTRIEHLIRAKIITPRIPETTLARED
jgi:hypothetical protein